MKKSYHFSTEKDERSNVLQTLNHLGIMDVARVITTDEHNRSTHHYIIYATEADLLYIRFAVKTIFTLEIT